ncbi:MAG: site-specific DNA-methyltransferase [Bacteroidetes bacterium]|nr:site-specific DNA-methyltransferase [Bacteroidota bacterium]
MRVTRTELVWPGKYNDDGTRREVPRTSLPFQVIERVNESRATREAQKTKGLGLFDIYDGREGESFEEGWRNKLIWGDNLLVMGSLLEKFAGKIDLIYIDPPFATGADFSFRTSIGDGDISLTKQQSIIEEKAYRDTWAQGFDSYLSMLHSRLISARNLLSDAGSIFVHLDDNMGPYVRVLMDEVFGAQNFINSITWQRSDAHSDVGQGAKHLGRICDCILYYCRISDQQILNMEFTPLPQTTIDRWYRHVEEGTGRRYNKADITGPGGAIKGNPVYEWNGITRAWRFSRQRMQELDAQGKVVYSASGQPYLKRYLDESKGVPLQDLWDDIKMIRGIHANSESLGYATQKPEALLERIINLASNPGDLVADFFCGSGTTLAVAEKLGRRWIGCDLGRWGVHVTRKRLLGIENARPFEVLNLGKYERKYWQGATFGESSEQPLTERALYEYLAFILKLYGAAPLPGMAGIHGRRGRAMVHIGAVDAPVTIAEIEAAVEECAGLRQPELHVLGWEWEMGLYDLVTVAAKRHGVKLLLLQIPREVMEQQAVEKGDVQFFELAYMEAQVKNIRRLTVQATLRDFVIPNTELIPEEVRGRVRAWSDYIDYWAVDWDFRDDTFMQGWVAYRTRRDRKLPLATDPHLYEKPGTYRVLIKAIDIFGNDTSQVYEVDVR